MIQNPLIEKKNTAFEKLSIATENHDKDEDQGGFFVQIHYTFFNRCSEEYKNKKNLT